ncbi:hypothetical protein OUZ56_023033 [Daphnia magna]|uniref:Uncharacterized protein n=1 Tax=Daphnia magna TaxID=35525 RepID=A0ABR0AY97_9CRUS|nr:hypothetical protein OUZ56_023033 [Daphnia magna]
MNKLQTDPFYENFCKDRPETHVRTSGIDYLVRTSANISKTVRLRQIPTPPGVATMYRMACLDLIIHGHSKNKLGESLLK